MRGYMHRAMSVEEDRYYWRYTLACAVCCSQIASIQRGPKLLAYAAGLFHDMGRLALIASYPDKYANILELTNRMFASDEPFDISEYERVLFGLDHFATGEWLATTWNLPAWLRPLVGRFNEPPSGGKPTLTSTVRAGTRLAHSLGFGYLRGAPRMDVKTIVAQISGTFDQSKLGAGDMTAKVQARLNTYAKVSGK
jgi:HD-like signal output (HDOD) protein